VSGATVHIAAPWFSADLNDATPQTSHIIDIDSSFIRNVDHSVISGHQQQLIIT
jgi:hypothetical protein